MRCLETGLNHSQNHHFCSGHRSNLIFCCFSWQPKWMSTFGTKTLQNSNLNAWKSTKWKYSLQFITSKVFLKMFCINLRGFGLLGQPISSQHLQSVEWFNFDTTAKFTFFITSKSQRSSNEAFYTSSFTKMVSLCRSTFFMKKGPSLRKEKICFPVWFSQSLVRHCKTDREQLQQPKVFMS